MARLYEYRYRFPFARYPAVRILILLSAGILTSRFIWPLSFVPASLFVAGSAFTLYRYHHLFSTSLRPGHYRLSIAGYLALIFFFGMAWGTPDRSGSESPGTILTELYTWEEVRIRGTVVQVAPTGSGNYQIDVDVDSTVLSDSTLWKRYYRARAFLDPSETALPPGLKPGTGLAFGATVYPLEEKRNPREFEYKSYLHSLGIYVQLGIDTLYTSGVPGELPILTGLREQILFLIDRNFSAGVRPLAKALLAGYKKELDRDQKVAFSRMGLSHIMAVSGLHVGFVVAPLWLLIPLFWTFRYGKQTGFTLILILLTGYAGVTGFSPSVCRASLTAGFIIYGKLFHRSGDSVNLTAAAAIVLLLLKPDDLFDPGFQLSFSAVFIIFTALPAIRRWSSVRIRDRWYAAPFRAVIISSIVQIGLFPLLAYYFREFSLVGPLANAIVIPMLGLVIPFALVLLPVTALFPDTGPLLNRPNELFLDALNTLADRGASLEWSWVEAGVESPFLFVVWPTAILLLSTLTLAGLRWKICLLMLFILVIQSGERLFRTLQPARLEVTFFDVGQGDAALVRTPAGKVFLIDTGRWAPGYNSARHILIPHMEAEGIGRLDAVFLSHPHADHIGGMAELLLEVPVDTIYDSGFVHDSALYEHYRRIAREKGIPIRSLSAGDRVLIDPSLDIWIYGPAEGLPGGDPNQHSLVMELIYGETEFLFMGDAGAEQERRLIERYGSLLDTDILKTGHHGSRTSSTTSLLSIATPEISVTSVARPNPFSHPHPETVRRIKEAGGQSWFTSLHRALVLVSDGTSIKQIDW